MESNSGVTVVGQKDKLNHTARNALKATYMCTYYIYITFMYHIFHCILLMKLSCSNGSFLSLFYKGRNKPCLTAYVLNVRFGEENEKRMKKKINTYYIILQLIRFVEKAKNNNNRN